MAIKHKIKFNTEVVNGLCPECNQDTVLVSIVPEFYKCTLYGLPQPTVLILALTIS